jgi:hypothetical protein
MTEQTATISTVGPTKFCTACGRSLDARAEICPGCGVRQAPIRGAARPMAGSNASSSEISVGAVLLAGAAAVMGSVGYVWAVGTDGPTAAVTLGYAAGWAIPIAIVVVLYLARALSQQLVAGTLLGMGLVQFFGWLPTLLPDSSSTGVELYIWMTLASGVIAALAGLVATRTRRTMSDGASGV